MSAPAFSQTRFRPQLALHWLIALLLAAATSLAFIVGAAPSQAVAPLSPPNNLVTPWTAAAQAAIANPLPEYPRPQMVRTQWQSLNGEWQWQSTSAGSAVPTGQTLASRINVPYPVESSLSGVQQDEVHNMWYRRTFTIPSGWAGQHVQLNFGAVAQIATVYVNGHQVGTHTGGYDAFSIDITSALQPGSNEIIVGVAAPIDNSDLPMGKQRSCACGGSGILYHASSGIWQDVWLEPTPAASISRLDMTPDVPGGALVVTVQGTTGQTATVSALLPGTQTVVGTVSGAVGSALRLPVPNAHLWSPSDPYLYDLRASLGSGDSVTSYFGMRSITTGLVNGVVRTLLNGKFVFQLGPLDQGYWPDGIYTAPTDAALKYDIQETKDLGFNTIRKHMKVESDRWYYWADKIGMLVWQDMPSMNFQAPSASDQAEFLREYHAIVNQHLSHPAIIQWDDENEGWGQFDQAGVANDVKSWDPSRLVDNMSGINCCGSVDGGNGDVADWHVYTGPASPGNVAPRAAVLGEFGGLTLPVAGHQWPGAAAVGTGNVADGAAFTSRYVSLIQQATDLMQNHSLNAAIYTQTTDVETEQNGLLTYDRQLVKGDPTQIRNANQALINASLAVGGNATNLLANPGFEADGVATSHPSGWLSTNDAADYTETGGHSGTYRLTHWSAAPYTVYSYQVATGLPNGTYTLSAWAESGGGQNQLFLQARNYQSAAGPVQQANIAAGGWQQVTIPNINVTNGQVMVGVYSGGNAGNWASFDDFSLTSTGPPTLAVGSRVSLANAGSGNSLQVSAGLGVTAPVTASSSLADRQAATFIVHTGLANAACYSFESAAAPGSYLRHSNYRLHADPNDNTAGFAADATFCTHPANNGGTGTSFSSSNYPDHYLRTYTGQAWIASNGGPNPSDSTTNWTTDTAWNTIPAWAP